MSGRGRNGALTKRRVASVVCLCVCLPLAAAMLMPLFAGASEAFAVGQELGTRPFRSASSAVLVESDDRPIHFSNLAGLPSVSALDRSEAGLWDRYGWAISLVTIIVLFQAVLISGLLHERQRRRSAEVELRQRLAELAHFNRQSTMGQLTASIAHELNQPLGAILTNAETAEILLNGASPDLDLIREILADIRRDDRRASEVIRRLHSVLKKTPFELKDIDLNETVSQVTGFVAAMAYSRNIALNCSTAPGGLKVRGDPVQLQQVVLNLIINAIDSIHEADAKRREVSVMTDLREFSAEIRIGDTGPGIASSDLNNVFDPFFTTRSNGMGMGLAIARSIVEAHHGQLWAANQPLGGALFTMRLPLLRGQSIPASTSAPALPRQIGNLEFP